MRRNLKFEAIRTSLAILIALAIALILIFSVSSQPLEALKEFLYGPIDSVRHFGNVIELAIPLTFTGLAISIMFKAKQFNLGAEGGFFIGAIIAMIVAIQVTLPAGIHPTVAILLGGVAGAIVLCIPAILKVRWGATELVSSLMLNYIAFFIGMYLLNYHFRDPNAGAMYSYKFPKAANLMRLIPKTRVHFGLIIVIVMIILCYYFLYQTKWGYAIRVTGENKRFAEYSGINTAKIIILAQVIGGFIAGMGGATEVLGMYKRFSWQASPGYGWDGVIVAILARNNPALVPIGALFLAYLRVGADQMARSTDVQSEVVAIIQGVIIVLIVADSFLSKYKHKLIYKEAKQNMSIKGAK
ncbi:ABC transporter permease [Vallitalea pronyensis]|uniref:ABC transporter permease n=1 Tax=Vallitalea pronyensis TaxID=1348613 RepID=A0A8J8MP36_9FIRM|nr:ABC transporter permease [Vallitalea pronyensis]QUI25044.1 ABC transporter permease [Vallitalea pronyensis]